MPYRRNNFSLIIEPSYAPMSMQEMLTPFMMYKDAYEKSEEAYNELSSQSDKFKYLSETLPEGSKARQLYEGYANELNSQAQDLARNGLSMGNRRALTNLRRRYQGEIGRLVSADAAMQEEKKLRRTMNAKDSSMLYATDNMSIDDFLDGATPNLYSVSGDELRKEGAQYAQAASSRIYGNTQISNINKYFQEIAQTQGYSPEVMAAWRENLESIPEFNQAVKDIMDARGVSGNLTGVNIDRARQSIINGIMEGSVYQEKRSLQQNPGVLTAAQENSAYLQKRGQDLSAANSNMKWDNKTRSWVFDEEQAKKRAEALGGDTAYNPEEWEKKPNGKGGFTYVRKQKVSQPKTEKKPKPSMRINRDGKYQTMTNKDGRNIGNLTTYQEAILKYPELGKYIPSEDASMYDYFDDGTYVTPIANGSKGEVSAQTDDETKKGNEGEHNVY